MADSMYRGAFLLKLVLFAASAIVLIGSYDERASTFLHTWLSVLLITVGIELFMSLFVRITRLIHVIQLFEFVWQCIAISEVWHLYFSDAPGKNEFLVNGVMWISVFFGIATSGLIVFLVQRKAFA